ncbi:pilus assembly PilX N-terminal domain-containing protein [Clostridium autoethanogenum]|uniref:Pilus assembly PilX N-terminal domain-containing protein n=1 Tax=Clostridium autoethanogenum DSM 10061 TaxID=1341692 RepID=A0ABN4BHA5_9CLOT|nr:PilX N-terminal domain-containing pilus assembly protein [Clostridium autoethanogenum]AGY76860.1 pilus assembly PilX N-terminal domain-containing protein [Clostridium autoethanogenum DSM 10061]ALU37008.1 Type 4 fimbrial biogenesis protein PilX [Clostridium autoethanogenum DSM 10061]OVY48704.1 hypothetical protein WX72_00344 [Clostridium autoethanogenum]
MKKRGSALIVVIIIMTVTFLLAAFMVDTSIKSNRVASDTSDKTRAYYSAETGIYDFINYVNDDIENNIKNNKLDISLGNSITNNYNKAGLYNDNMEAYKAGLMHDISMPQDSDYIKTYTFDVYSKGNFGSETCTIIVNVSILYTDNKYTSYTINSRKVED